jgi:hypothetical protein
MAEDKSEGQRAIEAIDQIHDRMKAHFTFEEKVVRIGLILERYYKEEEEDE